MKPPRENADKAGSHMTRCCAIAAAAALSACASSGAVPRPFPGPAAPPGPAPAPVEALVPSAAAPAATGYAIVGSALALRGAPYRNGGTDPSGFDCSGFVHYVFGLHGVALPRSVGELYQAGQSITSDRLAPGDLVFFDTSGGGASHVGIVVGGEEFVHAPSTRGVVRVERISGSYWWPRFVGARRIN